MIKCQKALQDAEQCHTLELNYFDDTTRPTSIEPMSEATEQITESSMYNLSSVKQESMEEAESAVNIPESLKIDTSHTSQRPSQPCTDTDEKHQQCPSSECAEQDADAYQEDDEHLAKDVTREPTLIHSDQLHTILLPTDDVINFYRRNTAHTIHTNPENTC